MRLHTTVVALPLLVPLFACAAGPADSAPNDDSSAQMIDWQEPIEVASGDAFRGPWRMNRSEFHFVDDPTIAINNRGEIGVVWADHRAQDVFFQRYSADGEPMLEEPVNASQSSGIFSWLPRMVMTDDDPPKVYVLVQDIVFSGGSHGGEIFFIRSLDGGKNFERPINLSNTTAGAGKGRLTPQNWHNGSLDLAIAPNGNLYAAWTEYEGALWFSRSTDGGESFSQPKRIAGDEDQNPTRGPSLAVSGEGTIYLAWTVGEDNSANIRWAKSDDEGESFSEPQTVYEGEGHADSPKLAVDREGTVHLVYAESPTGMFRQYHVRYTRKKPDGDSFDEPREISHGHGRRYESVSFPALSADGEGRLYVLWELFPHWRGRPRGLGMTWSGDGGETFARPSAVPGTIESPPTFSGSQQGLLMQKMAVNQAGAIAVVNSTYRDGEESRVRLIRGRLEIDDPDSE